MQVVSTDFQKAITSNNREIHGYVEVIYQEKKLEDDYSVNVLPTPSDLSLNNGSDIIDGVRIMKNYGTLENNYFLLDGSFLLPNKNTLYDSKGFVSEQTFENISDKTITIVADDNGIQTKGFTIFFKDNIAFDFDISIVDNENTENVINVRNNLNKNYQYIFENEITITSISLDIINVEYNDRRIRIPDISFGLVDLYQDNELVSFDVTEEVDIYGLSIPINSCVININNYPDENGNSKFDPLSPTGIIPYLNDNVKIKPYIGVLTDMNSVEYVKMGIFYLKDWSSNNDGNVTLNGISGMEKIKNAIIDTNNNHLFLGRYFESSQVTDMNEQLKNMTGFLFSLICPMLLFNVSVNYTTLEKWLFTIIPFLSFGKYYDLDDNPIYIPKLFHINRNNEVKIDDINYVPRISGISRNELINDVKYIQSTPINKFMVTYDQGFNNQDYSTQDNILNVNSYTLSDTTEYIWYKLDKRPMPLWVQNMSGTNPMYSLTYTTSGSGSVEIIDGNLYMAYIKYTGQPGDTFNVTINGYVMSNVESSSTEYSYENNNVNGDTLSINFAETAYVSKNRVDDTAYYYLYENQYNYKIEANTIGDPSLESGDKIQIQTRYTDNDSNGYKDIIITKQHFKFDGGLSCDLEGVGN